MFIDQMLRSITISLLGWVVSFAWDAIIKLFFALLLASFPLSVWLEREYTHHRQFDDMRERLKALQRHVMVILIALHVQPVNYRLHSVIAVESGCACCRSRTLR